MAESYVNEAAIEFLRTRRSLREFDGRPVAPELARAIVETARWAPSPHHTQPWRFALVLSGEAKTRLAAAMAARWRDDLAADGLPDERIERVLAKSQRRIAGAPAVVVAAITGVDLDRYPDPRRQAAEWTMASQSLGAALENILLAAHAYRLAAGWICAPLFCPDTVRAALRLESTWEPQALVLLGYPPRDPQAVPPRPPKPELVTVFR